MAQIILPYDINAESGVICTLILHPEFILHSENLKPAYFYKKENGAIYWAIEELYKKGIDKIDDFNILTQINSNAGVKKLMNSFNEQSLTELVSLAEELARTSLSEYKQISNRVISLSFKRELYKKVKDVENMCLDDTLDINVINKNIYETFDTVAEKYICDDDIQMFKDKIDDIWGSICNRRNNDGTFGLPSKFKILNEYFTYQPGELTLASARRKDGKSIFGLNELVHKLKHDIPVVYFDTEMQDELFTARLISHLTQIPEPKVKSGAYSPSEETLIKDALAWIKSRQFVHEYDPSWTKERVLTKAKILRNKMNFQFFIYDYIKITNNGIISSSEQYNELGNWCNFIKNEICGKFEIPGLSFAQLNRQGQIADSDKIERYVTTGLSLRKKSKDEIINDGEECGNYAIRVEFNRIGAAMDEDEYLDFLFRGNILTLEECQKQHLNEQPSFMS
jgi:replicative DNA helicase